MVLGMFDDDVATVRYFTNDLFEDKVDVNWLYHVATENAPIFSFAIRL